jgi:hypothetical protein
MRFLPTIGSGTEPKLFRVICARAWRWRAALTLVLLMLIWLGPPLLRGELLMMRQDGLVYFFLIKMLIGEMLAQGQAPLWNPYLFGGMPLLASIAPGALYPLNWVSALLPPMTAMTLTTCASYFLALSGSFLFGWRLGLPRTGAMVTAVSFTWGGFLIAQMDLTHYVAALVWLPWLLLAIEGLYQSCLTGSSGNAWRWVCGGAFGIALQVFAGIPQATFQVLLVCLLYALFSLAARGQGVRRWRFLLLGLTMAICGALLSAIQLLPANELRLHGERAEITYAFFSSWSMPWRQTLTLICPFFFGPQWRSFYQAPLKDEAWQVTLSHGYIGLTGLLLAITGIIGSRKSEVGSRNAAGTQTPGFRIPNSEFRIPQWRRMIRFWLGVAVLGLLLAAGDNLPLGAHQLLYKVPIYNLFRCPYRHLFEYSFAAAMLAGLGAGWLTVVGAREAKRALVWSSAALLALAAMTATAYRFAHLLFSQTIKTAPSLTDRELLIPALTLALSLAAVWFYWRKSEAGSRDGAESHVSYFRIPHSEFRIPIASLTLIAVLMLDLMLMGLGFEWNIPAREVREFYAEEPPAVSFIKARETDLNSFRLLSWSPTKYPTGYREMSYQNLPVAYHLQAISGYEPMRPNRQAEVAGKLDFEGTVRDASLLDVHHQGLNLLNVRYMLRQEMMVDTSSAGELADGFVRYDGLPFKTAPLNLERGRESHHALEANDFTADKLAIISSLAHSAHLPDDTVIARIRIHRRDGQIVEQELRAGRDTAEWAYDRSDVRAAIRHRRAPIAFSVQTDEGFPAHRFLTRFQLTRAEIDYVEFESVRLDVGLEIYGVSLSDTIMNQTRALNLPRLAPERWQRLKSFGALALYENKRALPRAWFVRQVETLHSAEVIQAVRSGRLPDGSAFEPTRVALLEREDMGERKISHSQSEQATAAQVKVIRYEPNRIELETSNPQSGFLVVSEMFYPGWKARLDGHEALIERADYILRGVQVPSGRHQLVFVFRPRSLTLGAFCFAAAVLILVVGAIIIRNSGVGSRKPMN